MKTRYYLPEHFAEEFNRATLSGLDFIYERTSYTKKLKYDSHTIVFNTEGRMDDRILALINRVRNDAAAYMALYGNNLPTTKIFFLDLFDIPKEKEIITKVDITKAYWKQAMMDGVITEETNKFLLENFKDYTQKALKGVRLKALGSLATRKEIEIFEEGKTVSWEIIEQPTKKIYMNICRSIDQIMRQCRLEVDGIIFYYWDCIFVRKGFSNQVVEFFKSKGFECTEEDTRLTYDKIGTKGYLTSEIDGKMYLVSSENRNLLPK